MKILALFTLILLFTNFSFAQEVQFPPTVLAAGGGVVTYNTVNISKWRIGEVNVLYIESEDLKSNSINELADSSIKGEGEIAVYPNPVHENLNVQFDTDAKKEICIKITDIAGRKVLIDQKQMVLPGQIIQLDFSGLNPSLYLVTAYSADKTLKAVFKIEKH